MNSVRELHDEAMGLAQDALFAREAGELQEAEDFARHAFRLEEEAAKRIAKEPRSEPTRSILYKSAASLAYQANEFAIAQRLIFEGLSGYPPPSVEQDLRDLYDQLNFSRHLEVRGVTLTSADVQIALAGNAVGTGQILYSAFHKRLEALTGLMDRTMRRMIGQPYQKGGQAPSSVRPFRTTISVARAGSFAITLQLLPRDNQQLPLGLTPPNVIDEVLSGIDLIERNRPEDLAGRFPDERYYRNFVASAQQLAPDGDNIILVGLTTTRRTIEFRRPAGAIRVPISVPENLKVKFAGSLSFQLHGVLDFADARNDDLVGLTTADGKVHNLLVQDGLEDMVRSYFKKNVTVVAQRAGDDAILLEVQGED